MLRHSLPKAHFAELARGAGSAGVIRELWESQRSRKMVLLRAFWEEANREPALLGPLAPLDEAWLMLERLQEKNPEHFATLLDYPQVGSWLAYTLRRRRGGANSTAPWYIDFGQLNSLALAGAALAGESFTTRVPLCHGRVLVPCFGMAYFPDCDPWEIAEAGVSDGRLWLRHNGRVVNVPQGADADGWWALHRVHAGTDPALTVWLD